MKKTYLTSVLLVPVLLLAGCNVASTTSLPPNPPAAASTGDIPAIIPVGGHLAVHQLQHDEGNEYEIEIDNDNGQWTWFDSFGPSYRPLLSLTKDSKPYTVQIKTDKSVSGMVLERMPDYIGSGLVGGVKTASFVVLVPEGQGAQAGIYDKRVGKTTTPVRTSMVGGH